MAKVYGDRWKTEKQIAIGGQAYIYIVKDLKTQDGKNYVLKRLKNPHRKGRFEREIEALRVIRSKYISEIIDYKISEKDVSYYVMPFYSEKTLQDILTELKDDYERCTNIFEKICIGIKSAHEYETPIIHRDLKPANILIDEKDNPKIIDFGLCYIEEEERLTLSMEQVGSRFYISPECEEGRSKDIGSHTDIYSLGKILYAMASGGNIFTREFQKDPQYNLIEISNNKRSKYIMEIINRCVLQDINERIGDINILISLVRDIKNLLKNGFLPVDYDSDLCRFCGRGKLRKLGQLRGSILKVRNITYDISSYNIYIWECNHCGHVYFFNDDIYKQHKQE